MWLNGGALSSHDRGSRFDSSHAHFVFLRGLAQCPYPCKVRGADPQFLTRSEISEKSGVSRTVRPARQSPDGSRRLAGGPARHSLSRDVA